MLRTGLLPARSAVLDRAFLGALNDPDEEIVRLARTDVGCRRGPEGTAALHALLPRDWRDIRLNSPAEQPDF